MDHRAWMLLLLPFCAVAAGEDDEARIEALIRAERIAAAPGNPDTPSAVPPNAQTTVSPVSPAQPATVVAVVPRAPEPAARQSPQPEAALADPDTPQELRFDDLKQHLGEVLYVVTTNGAGHYAQIESASARQVTLRMRQAGGTAVYTLDRNQIAHIQAR